LDALVRSPVRVSPENVALNTRASPKVGAPNKPVLQEMIYRLMLGSADSERGDALIIRTCVSVHGYLIAN
jgi:hypothetical protein